MAETADNHDEPTFLSKRKSDHETLDLPNKSPKLASVEETNPNNSEVPSSTNCSSELKEEGHDEENGGEPDDNGECEPENGSDEEEDDDDEDSEGEPVVDRKGKGILREDKGKGILIEEDDEDDEDGDDDDSDSDDDDSDGYLSGSDSGFSDDPLAEVDLNNILPSRTRRQTGNPGVHIAGDLGNAGNDDDDSDS